MSDQWTDRLSEYLDDELRGSERAMLEAHLGRCEDCQQTLAGLRRVVLRARSLEDRPPAADLWAGIAERIGAPGRRVVPLRRRFAFSVPQLLAAGIALAALSASGAWMLHPAATTVVVQPAPVIDIVTVTRANYRQSRDRWDVRGTTNVPGATITLSLVSSGQEIATAVADAAGFWLFDVRGAGIFPVPGDSIRATSSSGGVIDSQIVIQP